MNLPKKGLAMLLAPEGEEDGPPSSRRGASEGEGEDDDKEEQDQADQVWEAVKSDDKEAFKEALLSLIYICTKEG